MIYIKFFILSFALTISGCATYSVDDVKHSPGYHKSISVAKGYQESLFIVKNEFSAILGMDLSCINNFDLKKGECTATGGIGTMLYVTVNYVEKDLSQIEFYTAWNTTAWKNNIEQVCIKLNK